MAIFSWRAHHQDWKTVILSDANYNHYAAYHRPLPRWWSNSGVISSGRPFCATPNSRPISITFNNRSSFIRNDQPVSDRSIDTSKQVFPRTLCDLHRQVSSIAYGDDRKMALKLPSWSVISCVCNGSDWGSRKRIASLELYPL